MGCNHQTLNSLPTHNPAAQLRTITTNQHKPFTTNHHHKPPHKPPPQTIHLFDCHLDSGSAQKVIGQRYRQVGLEIGSLMLLQRIVVGVVGRYCFVGGALFGVSLCDFKGSILPVRRSSWWCKQYGLRMLFFWFCYILQLNLIE